jgi:hypothetical protein
MRIITRNEQVSGSSPLVGSVFCLQILQKPRAPNGEVSGFVSSTSAVASALAAIYGDIGGYLTDETQS